MPVIGLSRKQNVDLTRGGERIRLTFFKTGKGYKVRVQCDESWSVVRTEIKRTGHKIPSSEGDVNPFVRKIRELRNRRRASGQNDL
jgi:hypothetical protein